MNPSSINALTRTLAGLFRQHFAEGFAGARVAPVIAAGPNGEYQIITGQTRLGPDAPMRTLAADDTHRRAHLQFGSVSVALKDYDGLYTVIPQAIAEGIALGQQGAFAGTGFSVVDTAIKELSNYLQTVHEKTVVELVTEDLDAADDVLDLTLDSADVVGYLRRLVQRVRRTSKGGRPTAVCFSETVADRFRTLDVFQINGVSVSDARRAGGTEEDALPRLFRERTGLDLIISDAIELDAAGEGQDVWGTTGVLFDLSGGASGKTTMKTFAQQGGDLFVPTVRPTANDERVGVGVTNEGRWKVEATEPETGLRIEVTGVDTGGSPGTPGS